MIHGRPALAAALLVLALVAARGAAAAGIETLIMPGKVTTAHAKIEQECSQCHDRADRDRQAALCLACHKEVAADVREGKGFHGHTPGIQGGQCRACHTEHAGRGADIVKLSPHAFDHDRTDFRLAGRHATAACENCHKSGRKYREAPSACIDCHRNADPHGGRLGNDCGRCHEPAAWSRTRFDHDKTRYPLRDAHREVACAGCHSGNHYQDVPSACAACHAPGVPRLVDLKLVDQTTQKRIAEQSCSRPCRQPSQRPHACDGETATRSPFFTRVTPGPTDSTVADASWPGISGSRTTKLPLRPSK